jgi:hypothetical protein
MLALLLVGLRPLWPLTAFWPWPHLAFGVLFVLLIVGRPLLDKFSSAMLRIPSGIFLAGCMLVGFGLALAANILVLEKIPHVTDSVAYYFQAKVMASGHLTAQAPACVECFLPHFYYTDGERLISLFQYGWPTILALGTLFGLPFAVNPLLGALMLWPLYRIVRRGFGERIARYTLLLTIISPFYIYMSASFMSHPLCALLGLIALDQVLLWRTDARGGRLALIGVLVGFLALVRAYNALLVGLVLSVFVIACFVAATSALRVRVLKQAALSLVMAGLLASTQLWINAGLTGDPLRFAQDNYFQLTEKVPTCHRLGFGQDVGCEREHGSQYGFRKGYHFPQALVVTRQRLDSLALNLFGLPWALWLMVVPIAIGPLRREGLAGLLLIAALSGGYFLFYYHGNCYGPRFYFESIGFFMMLIALGLTRLDGVLAALGERLPDLRRVLAALAPAMLLTLLGFTAVSMHPSLAKNYHRFRGLDAELKQIVEKADIHNAIVLLPGNSVTYSVGFIYNSPDFNDDVLYAQHIWDHSVQLMYLYPDRTFYRFEPRRDVLIKIKKQTFNGVIFNELDAKLPPVDLQGGFIVGHDITQYKPELGEALQAYMRADGPGARVRMVQEIMEAGEYRVEIDAMKGPFMAEWALTLNGERLSETFDGYSSEYGFAQFKPMQTVRLPKGRVFLEFTVVGKDSKALGYGLGLDYMVLRKLPEGLYQPVPRIEDVGYIEDGKLVPIGKGWIPWEKWSGWKK